MIELTTREWRKEGWEGRKSRAGRLPIFLSPLVLRAPTAGTRLKLVIPRTNTIGRTRCCSGARVESGV